MPLNPNGYGVVPGRFTTRRATAPIVPNGRAASPAWAAAERTPRFVDMLTGAPAPMTTTATGGRS